MSRVKLLFLSLLITSLAQAQSVADFPFGWEKSWVLVKESFMPGSTMVLPEDTPLFIQDTVKAYNWINNGEGTKLNIYVNPNKLQQYKSHGPYEDGATAIAIYEDSNIIFVTEHIAGEPIYGTYDRDGNDISQSHPSFRMNKCVECHDGYRDVCIGGTCAVPIIDIFSDQQQ